MKIMFICGSLEPGRDGVGDYTRRLACEMIHQGHQAALIAIGDKHIREEWKGWQEDNHIPVEVLRLPDPVDWNKRLAAAKAYITAFNVDWISLQFVLFSFDLKGLPFGLYSKVKKLNDGKAKWHIMFHELWIAMNKEASLKQKLVGYVQKQLLRSFLDKLKPSVIHTHARIYQNKLKRLGYEVKPLPLFTNLFINETIFKPSEENKREEQKAKLIFSLFGGIHPGAPVQEFTKELAQYASLKNIKAEVRILGRTGKEQEVWVKALQARNIETKLTGELSADDVTKELFTSHFGLSTTSISLVDKSSSVATMLGHGLPVICVAKSWQIKKIKNENPLVYLFDYKPGSLAGILDSPYNKAQAPSLLDVSKQFTLDLNQSEKNSL